MTENERGERANVALRRCAVYIILTKLTRLWYIHDPETPRLRV